MSRAALYHAAVDGIKELLDDTATVSDQTKSSMVDGMRRIVPRDATDAQFEARYAFVTEAVADDGNHDVLSPLPFEIRCYTIHS